MKALKIFLGAGSLILSNLVYAAGGQTPPGAITAVTIYNGHTGILINQTTQIDPDQCGRQDYFILPDTHPHFKEAYSLLLATHMAGKKVSLVISGCHQGIPAISHIVTSNN